MARAAFLLGAFAVPIVLLFLGHGFRHRSTRVRTAFWGGSLGYLAGMIATTAFALLPPTQWDGGPAFRALVVHWGMLAGALAGVAISLRLRSERGAIGGALARTPARTQHRPVPQLPSDRSRTCP